MKRLTLFLCFMILILFSDCGYHISGTGKHIPDYIKTIIIPDFENKTTKFQAEKFVNISIKEEFIKKSNLVLTDRMSEADSILEGEILKFDVKSLSLSENDSSDLYKVKIILNIRFIDLKTSKIIFEGKNLRFSDNYEINSGDFFSQEIKILSRIAKKFASSIVSIILENF